jgi:hypothetical protein
MMCRTIVALQIAVLSTVDKLFELMVFRYMYEDLKGQLADCLHGSSFALKSIEDGCRSY